jgi:hypothetical protein
MGLKSDGTIVCWGNNGYGQCTVPSPNEDFMTIAGGSLHSLGLKSDGSVVAWGYNGSGQCTVPSPNGDFIAIVAGDEFSMAIWYDGTSVEEDPFLHGDLGIELLSPNPFEGLLPISFHSPVVDILRLEFFAVCGRLIRIIDLGGLAEGFHSTTWDGAGLDGRELDTGVYLIRLRGPLGSTQFSRVILF